MSANDYRRRTDGPQRWHGRRKLVGHKYVCDVCMRKSILNYRVGEEPFLKMSCHDDACGGTQTFVSLCAPWVKRTAPWIRVAS